MQKPVFTPLKLSSLLDKTARLFRKQAITRPPDQHYETDRQMLIRIARQFALLFIVILLLDEILEFVIEVLHFIFELLHLFIEAIEEFVESVLELLLNTGHHASETIIVNTVLVVMERQLVTEDSVSLLNVLKGSGVKVLLHQAVQGFSREGDKVSVNTGVSAAFDAVIVATGFKPRTELAEQAGLETGRGIKVNQRLQTSDEHIYALGDVAELPNGKLYAFILPIRNQALWLAGFLAGQESGDWQPPAFNPKAKVHGFEATHPYLF